MGAAPASIAPDAAIRDAQRPLAYDKLFIGGEWVTPRTSRAIDSIDPATEEVWARVPEAGAEDVNDAVVAARAALRGPWSRTTPTRRGELLARLADLVRRDAVHLATVESRDNGKPFHDTHTEMLRAADWLVFYAGCADKLNGYQIPTRHDALAYTRREPVGVVAAILPWNSPVIMAAWKLGPALAAGNAIIIKPAEQTPVSAMELAKLTQEAGFPAGVVSVLPGYGAEAGNALASHPGVNKIAFTGAYSTAQRIMKSAAGNLKRLTFECGGKSPFIVFDDAEVDRALSFAVKGAYRSTSQSCACASRIFVQQPLYERFARAFAERAQAIRIGLPFDRQSEIGPQTSAQQLAKTMEYIDIGHQSGGRLLAGGGRPRHLERGYFVEPTVFADVPSKSRLAQEEVFGPVISLIPFRDEDEAIAMANDSDYGLVGAVWTADAKRAHRVTSQMQAGFITVNTYLGTHPSLPYGGVKLSGMGRENGLETLLAYTDVKTVVVELGDGPAGAGFGSNRSTVDKGAT